MTQETDWEYEIKPKGKFIDLNLKEIWRYRDLLVLFIKRDITTVYKQTVLGPLWFLIQPLFTAFTLTFIFNGLANIETGVVPSFLFNLAGITLWNYFSESLNSTSSTFTANAGLFGKVYFPRFIVPASRVLSGLFKYGIQLLIFALFYMYFLVVKDAPIFIGYTIWAFPLVLMTVWCISLGLGMIFSSMTTKYRDMTIVIGFGMSLFMYVSGVLYPLSLVEEKFPDYAWIVNYNPLAQVIEAYRYMLLGTGQPSLPGLLWSFLSGVVLLLVGLVIFNRTEKTFIDTV